MRLTENRKLGAAAVILCALISVFGLGGIKLNCKYDALENTFIYGTETQLSTRHSMDAYLDRCCENATDLAQEAKQYIPDSENIEKVFALAAELGATDGMDGRYSKYESLTGAVEDLYSELQTAGHDSEVAVAKAWGNFGSARDLLKRDGYHAAAAEYNGLLDAFPASAISGLWGLDEAESFGR